MEPTETVAPGEEAQGGAAQGEQAQSGEAQGGAALCRSFTTRRGGEIGIP